MPTFNRMLGKLNKFGIPTIPVKACVSSFPVVERQGIIWMWADVGEAGDVDLIPTIADLDDEPGLFCADYIRDLPYDQTYFMENVIDPAHVYISHDGILGERENIAAIGIAILADGSELKLVAVLVTLAAVATSILAQLVKIQFEQSYIYRRGRNLTCPSHSP